MLVNNMCNRRNLFVVRLQHRKLCLCFILFSFISSWPEINLNQFMYIDCVRRVVRAIVFKFRSHVEQYAHQSMHIIFSGYSVYLD